MSVTVKLGASAEKTQKDPIAKVELDIRRTLDGDIMIFDHADIDIFISSKSSPNKISTFPKDIMSEVVYGAQDRLFKFLVKKGLVRPDTVQGGSVYGSIEAEVLSSEEVNPLRMSIINIEKWIDEERPYFEFVSEQDDIITDRFTDPDEEESTELGEIPHDGSKGSLKKGYNYGPYWQSYTYE